MCVHTQDWGKPHHAYVVLNHSRSFLVEALHEYVRELKCQDERTAITLKKWMGQVDTWARTELFGLENVCPARLLVWMLQTGDFRLDLLSFGGQLTSFNSFSRVSTSTRARLLFNTNFGIAHATRGEMLTLLYGESEADLVARRAGRHECHTCMTQSMCVDCPPWGEDDDYANVSLDDARDIAARSRSAVGRVAPGLQLPGVDVDSDLPPSAGERPPLPPALEDTSDERGQRHDVQHLLEHRGYKHLFSQRFDAAQEQERVVRRRLDLEDDRRQRQQENPTLGSRGFVIEDPATVADQVEVEEERLDWQENYEDRDSDVPEASEEDEESSSDDDSWLVPDTENDDTDGGSDYDPSADRQEYEDVFELPSAVP